MLQFLNKFLTSCRVTKKMKHLSMLTDANEQYCVKRAEEAIKNILLGDDSENNYRLAVQLLTIGYYKHTENMKKLEVLEKNNLAEEIEENIRK